MNVKVKYLIIFLTLATYIFANDTKKQTISEKWQKCIIENKIKEKKEEAKKILKEAIKAQQDCPPTIKDKWKQFIKDPEWDENSTIIVGLTDKNGTRQEINITGGQIKQLYEMYIMYSK
ncbi:MAG: hypothetical protein LBG21_01220 [Campylobacteraceae bacterium]|jgi:3-deoxy-D-arabino-heptulosonate 7-phosphate (DAHP) synthase|nr:hypothetical protein [Campylobacteraceae bacterium]